MSSDFCFVPLGSHHDRAAFSCGQDSLDDFIKTKARKERDLGYCAIFVMAETPESREICGFYTISPHSISLTGISEEEKKKLPKYPEIPVTIIGRLARSSSLIGKNCGEILLLNALETISNATAPGYAVVVDAIDDKAAAFYKRYGFQAVQGSQNRFYISMKTVKSLNL